MLTHGEINHLCCHFNTLDIMSTGQTSLAFQTPCSLVVDRQHAFATMVCTRAQVRFFVFRLLCELRLEVLMRQMGPRQKLALEYVLYGIPPYTSPPTSVSQVKEVWRTFPGGRVWNMALFDYLEGLTEALVKQDPFSKPNPSWEVFRVCVNYHYEATKRNNIGVRPCTPYELEWTRTLGNKDEGLSSMYDYLEYCMSPDFRDFIFRMHDDADLMVMKMQTLHGNVPFPDLVPNEKDHQKTDDGWSTA